MKTKFSIVIPTFNTPEEWLNQAIESALKVSNDIIIVDDGSVGCRNIPDYKVTWLIYAENRGVGHARNQGIRLAKYDYIICLDSDDILKESIKDLECETDIVAIGHKHFGDRTDNYIPKSNLTLEDFKDYNRMCVSSPFRKSLWEKVGGFDEELGGIEDYEFWVRCLKAGATISTVKEPLLNYRIHPNGRNQEATRNYKQLHAQIWK